MSAYFFLVLLIAVKVMPYQDYSYIQKE